MSRSGQAPREPYLFDLPLVVDPEVADEADRKVKKGARREAPPAEREARQIELPAPATEQDRERGGRRAGKRRADKTAAAAARARRFAAALIRRRFQAGLIDTAASGAGLAVLVVGSALLGAPVRGADWPAVLLTLLLFSFFYVVFSLAFWGHTPGMIRARLRVSRADGSTITTGQAVRRWLGGVVTVALLGLPTFLALRDRRSLADRVSDSRLASG